MAFHYEEDKKIDLTKRYVHGKRTVSVLGEPDSKGRVPIKYEEDGRYGTTEVRKLKLLEAERCKFWWVRDNLHLRVDVTTGHDEITIPKSAVPNLLKTIESYENGKQLPDV